MNRKTFDVMVSVGGIVIAISLLVLGLVFHSNASFAKGNVRDQLRAQKVFFPPASALSAEEKAQPGVVRYAGQQVTTGDQARVYANEFIALHLRGIAGGKTYSELSTASRANPQDQKLAGLVQTAFRGETLRGLLLTSFAFWTLGAKSDQTALVVTIGAGILLILSVFGFWHAARTPNKEQLLIGQPPNGRRAPPTGTRSALTPKTHRRVS